MSQELATQLAQAISKGQNADAKQKLLMCRFLVHLVRQLGYHFAKT